MIGRLLNSLVFSMTLCLITTKVDAQCCSAGNPVGGDLLQSSIGKHSLRLTTQFKHSFSDQYYYQDHAEDIPQIKFSRFNYMNFQFIYGVSDKFNVFGELGYFFDKSQSVNIQGNHLFQASGIGDLTLNAKYVVFANRNKTKELNISGGVKLPVGAFDQEQEGVVLPLSLQPSNGSTKYTGSLYYFHRPFRSKLGFYWVSTIEVNSTIQSKNFFYKYGNVYINSLSGTYKLNDNISFVLQARAEIRAKDKREDNQIVSSTGSTVIFVAPMIQYRFLKNWETTLQADYPVYKYVQGSQLTNKYSYSISLARKISFRKKIEDKPISFK
ncbi:MAG: transporter [Bacteroidetes bacterium]|nr:transporter [Bacteroidota bacterium]